MPQWSLVGLFSVLNLGCVQTNSNELCRFLTCQPPLTSFTRFRQSNQYNFAVHSFAVMVIDGCLQVLQFAPGGASALSRSELATCSAVHFVKHHRTPPIQKPIYAARRLLGCGYFWDHILKVKVEHICYGNLSDFSLLSGNDVTCRDEFRKRSFSALAVAFAAPSAKLASVVEDRAGLTNLDSGIGGVSA